HALLLALDLPDAHVVLGRALEVADFNLVGAEVAFRKAVALAPDAAGPKLHLGRALAELGRLEQGVEQLRQALQLDPLNSRIYRALADIQLGMGQLDAAEVSIRKAIALRPDAASNHRTLVYIHVCRGDAAAALRDAQQEPGLGYRDVENMMALQVSGDAAKADAALAQLIAKYGDYCAFQVAGAYALRKDPDQAFAWLDRAWAARDGGIVLLRLDPFLLAYRDDPRFAAFCRKVGFPAPDCTDR
ncbi:MAG: tetratricopeptide repeat protein, partial [Pseudomonadota bacterium]|nr:tetratricopeptide repeat protein [Pseudomonadota bacterium]